MLSSVVPIRFASCFWVKPFSNLNSLIFVANLLITRFYRKIYGRCLITVKITVRGAKLQNQLFFATALVFLGKSLFLIIFKSNISNAINNKVLNANSTIETIAKVKTVPMNAKSTHFSIMPKIIVGRQNRAESSINFRYFGFSTHFFCNKIKLRIVVSPNTKAKPTSKE